MKKTSGFIIKRILTLVLAIALAAGFALSQMSGRVLQATALPEGAFTESAVSERALTESAVSEETPAESAASEEDGLAMETTDLTIPERDGGSRQTGRKSVTRQPDEFSLEEQAEENLPEKNQKGSSDLSSETADAQQAGEAGTQDNPDSQAAGDIDKQSGSNSGEQVSGDQAGQSGSNSGRQVSGDQADQAGSEKQKDGQNKQTGEMTDEADGSGSSAGQPAGQSSQSDQGSQSGDQSAQSGQSSQSGEQRAQSGQGSQSSDKDSQPGGQSAQSGQSSQPAGQSAQSGQSSQPAGQNAQSDQSSQLAGQNAQSGQSGQPAGQNTQSGQGSQSGDQSAQSGQDSQSGRSGQSAVEGSQSNKRKFAAVSGGDQAEGAADSDGKKPEEASASAGKRTAPRYEVTVTAESSSVLYDGAPHAVRKLQGTKFRIVNEQYSIKGLAAFAEGTDAGEYPVEITGNPTVRDSAGNDVTEQFSINLMTGTLQIRRRTVILTSSSAQKQYSGTPLTEDHVRVSGDGFADGEGAVWQTSGAQTDIGSSLNTFTWSLTPGTKQENYDIRESFGTLLVVNARARYEITLQAKSETVQYDGAEHSLDGFLTTCFGIGSQIYTVEGMDASVSSRERGIYTSAVTGTPVVRDASGRDVTSQFRVITRNGLLKIT